MKRIFLILLVLFSALSFSLAQEEELEDEFFEDEPVIDPMDEPISAPPTWESDEGNNNSPRPNLPRPSGGFQNPSPPPSYSGSSGEVQFRLVDPPAFKKPKPPLRIPPRIRRQVEDNLKSPTGAN